MEKERSWGPNMTEGEAKMKVGCVGGGQLEPQKRRVPFTNMTVVRCIEENRSPKAPNK